MNPSEFARRHGRIAHLSRNNPKRAAKCRKALAKRAGAVPIANGHGYVFAYKLPEGVACVCYRYRDEAAAIDELARIWDAPARSYTPNHSFFCPHCKAFHLGRGDYRGLIHARKNAGA